MATLLKVVKTWGKAKTSAFDEVCDLQACSTFLELTTVSSELRLVQLGGAFNDNALCSFLSRTVGNWEEAEATEGRERRPRPREVD